MNYYDLAPDRARSERDCLSEIFKAARQRGTGNTGIFGLRLQQHSFEFFIQKLRVLVPGYSNDHERVQHVFGRTLFVHLTRQNKLEQAISYVKASQTGLWHRASNGRELERLSTSQELVYDARAIREKMTEFDSMDDEWNAWFAEEKLSPWRITYENLSEVPLVVTGALLEALGLSKELVLGLEIPVAKLADSTNKEWAELFSKNNGS